jgi:putative SOS response-associated peptidase YedK
MCGRKTLTKGKQEILESLFADEWQGDDFQPSWNVAPTHPHPTLLHQNGRRLIQMMRWGLIPSWAKDNRFAASMINARQESLTEKPAFRSLLNRQHCLVIMDGYYEWKSDSMQKQPFYIYPETPGLLLAAGLWDRWNGQLSYTIVTTEAQGALKELHPRMPLFLNETDAGLWLTASPKKSITPQSMSCQFEKLLFHPVSLKVNSVGNNFPQLIQPVEIGGNPQLSLF